MIGAGACGLTAAHKLGQSGLNVTVLDKSRGVGGRLSTRRIDGLGAVDLGAQYFTATTPDFRDIISLGLASGTIATWDANIAYHKDPLVKARYVGCPSMHQWLTSLWPREQIVFNQKILRLEFQKNGLWKLHGSSSDAEYAAVILAIPPAQAAALVPNTSVLKEPLLGVDMDPCWAALAVFDKPLPVAYEAAFLANSGLDWICANHSKPGRTQHPAAWTLHANPTLSRQLLDAPESTVVAAMLSELQKVVGSKLPPTQRVLTHRWLYAKPTSPEPPGVLWDSHGRVGAGGDWSYGGRVEAAYLAGNTLADRLIEDLKFR